MRAPYGQSDAPGLPDAQEMPANGIMGFHDWFQQAQ